MKSLIALSVALFIAGGCGTLNADMPAPRTDATVVVSAAAHSGATVYAVTPGGARVTLGTIHETGRPVALRVPAQALTGVTVQFIVRPTAGPTWTSDPLPVVGRYELYLGRVLGHSYAQTGLR